MIALRPSNAGRWVACPASPRMEAPFPGDESEDAKEGTAAHWLAEQVLGGHVSAIEELTDRAAPNGVIVTGDMVEHTQFYIDTVYNVTRTPIVERLMQTAPGVEPGTPDALYVAGRAGHTWDFKYGYRIVDAPGNWQLAVYAVGLFAKHAWELDTVTATIVQPRPFHPDGRARSWTITRDEGLKLLEQISNAAAATQSPDAQCSTGAHCNYCSALHVCEAARRSALNAVDVTHAATSVDLPPDALAGELRTLRRAHEAIKLREDALESHATAQIDAGVIIPGFVLDRSFGNRRWKDGVDITVLEALMGISLSVSKPIRPAAAEKAGAPQPIVDMYTLRPETGRKLIERDNSAKAREVFK